ncbi:MAG TPA: hypothetical protein VIX83_03200 [Candidatus Cybelea sp.]
MSDDRYDPNVGPIVFARCDTRPGNEARIFIYRPDRATDENETELWIRASSLDQEALSEIGQFIDAARPLIEEMGRAMRDKPIESLSSGIGELGPAMVW